MESNHASPGVADLLSRDREMSSSRTANRVMWPNLATIGWSLRLDDLAAVDLATRDSDASCAADPREAVEVGGITGCSVVDSGAWLIRDEVIDLTEGQVRKPLVGGGCVPFLFHADPIGNATLLVASNHGPLDQRARCVRQVLEADRDSIIDHVVTLCANDDSLDSRGAVRRKGYCVEREHSSRATSACTP